MFFSNKENNHEVQELQNEVASLQKELDLYKAIAAFSLNEMVIVFDEEDRLVFQNERASKEVQDMAALLTELKKGNQTIELNHCTGKVNSRKVGANTIYALIKTDMRDTRDSNVLSLHQQAITNALTDTQCTFEKMLEDLHIMKNEAVQIADESKEGLKLIYESTDAMDSLSQNMQENTQGMHSLNERSKEISTVVTLIQDIADQTNLLLSKRHGQVNMGEDSPL